MDSIENLKWKLKNFVKVKKVDSPWTHLKQILLFKDQDKICGSFVADKITIWVSNHEVIGMFYPVIQLTPDRTGKKMIIKSEMNPIGLGIALIINILIIWPSLNVFILEGGLITDTLIRRIIVFVVFVGIFNVPIYLSYVAAREELIKDIERRVQAE